MIPHLPAPDPLEKDWESHIEDISRKERLPPLKKDQHKTPNGNFHKESSSGAACLQNPGTALLPATRSQVKQEASNDDNHKGQ